MLSSVVLRAGFGDRRRPCPVPLPLFPKRELIFTHKFGWTPGVSSNGRLRNGLREASYGGTACAWSVYIRREMYR
jgi:hypothetical protein